MPVYSWSQTAANNTNADSTVNFQEGQLGPTNNDSFRAAMAAFKDWVIDISGNLLTTGGPVSFAVATNSGFTNLSQLSGQMLAIKFNQTNSSGGFYINPDGLGDIPVYSKGIRLTTASTLQVGEGAVYVVTYDNGTNAWHMTVSP